MTDRNAKRYLDYFKTIPKDVFHPIKKYAPENPLKFVHYLKMLPKGCYEIKGSEFKIIGEL